MKNTLVTLFASVFVIVSCSINEIDYSPVSKETKTIYASTEVDTKTTLSDNINGVYKVIWSEGDQIALIDEGGYTAVFVTDEGAKSKSLFKYKNGKDDLDFENGVIAGYPVENIYLNSSDPKVPVFITIPSVQEYNGNTFSDNALIKAKYFYDKYHIITISDDSGLVVPSLNGEPGVFSSRYSGLGDEENNKLLLKNLENKTDRSAYYEVSICFYDGNKPEFFIGKCFGKIGFEEKGENGFGYDPLFIYGEKTFSEIPLDEKNKFSHRAIALKQFIAFFEKNYLQNQ
jgi:XTP/dITP diphosphohydrolase